MTVQWAGMQDEESTRPLHAPQYAARPHLVAYCPGGVQQFSLDGRGPWVIGRSKDCDIRLPEASLSRRHCELSVRDGSARIRDLGSRHGTWVGGTRLDETQALTPVFFGELVELGEITLVVRGQPDEAVQVDCSYAAALRAGLGFTKLAVSVLISGAQHTGRSRLAVEMARACKSASFRVWAGAELRLEDATRLQKCRVLLLTDLDKVPRDCQVALAEALGALPGLRVYATAEPGLEQAASLGEFAPSLLRRIAHVEVRVPTLGDDRPRLDPLCDELLAETAHRVGLGRAPNLSPRARARLHEHDWPGNVVELKQVLDAAIARCEGGSIEVQHLLLPAPRSSLEAREAQQREEIQLALASHAGNQTRAAQALGISRRTLSNRISKLGIARPRKRG